MRSTRNVLAWITLLAVGIFAAAITLSDARLQISSLSAQTEQVEQQLRISAQRLDNGRVQFGVRAPDGAGGWADPVEPRVNWFLPSSSSANRWLNSSGLTLERVADVAGLVGSEQFAPTQLDPIGLQLAAPAWSERSGDILFSASADNGNVTTTASMYSVADGTVDGELRVDLSCDDGELSTKIGGLSVDPGLSARR